MLWLLLSNFREKRSGWEKNGRHQCHKRGSWVTERSSDLAEVTGLDGSREPLTSSPRAEAHEHRAVSGSPRNTLKITRKHPERATAVSLWTAAPMPSTKETLQRLSEAPKEGPMPSPLTTMTATRTPEGSIQWPGQICWVFMAIKFCVATSCPQLKLQTNPPILWKALNLPLFSRYRNNFKKLAPEVWPLVLPEAIWGEFSVRYVQIRSECVGVRARVGCILPQEIDNVHSVSRGRPATRQFSNSSSVVF